MGDPLKTAALMATWYTGAVLVALVLDWLIVLAMRPARTVEPDQPDDLWQVREWPE